MIATMNLSFKYETSVCVCLVYGDLFYHDRLNVTVHKTTICSVRLTQSMKVS